MQSFKICLALAVLSCAVGCNKANTAPPDDAASTWQANPQSKQYVSDMKKYYQGTPPPGASVTGGKTMTTEEMNKRMKGETQ